MATAEQLKALLRSYVDEDEDQFLTISMQIAAHAARKGHSQLAQDLRDLLDAARTRVSRPVSFSSVPIARQSGELADLIHASYPKTHLADMVLSDAAYQSLNRVLDEYRQQDKLRVHGMSARRKLLLVGPPGSGKTMTAAGLAGELGLPLLGVRLDGLISKFMGETAAKLRVIFDSMLTMRGVYLFDEFDAVGGDRRRPDDVGEMRRVLNSFLQFLEVDDSDSLILAATNHQDFLDPALFRRFDDVVQYHRPTPEQAEQLIKNCLNTFELRGVCWDKVRKVASGLSCAEIARASTEAAKMAVLGDDDKIGTKNLIDSLNERSVIVERNTKD